MVNSLDIFMIISMLGGLAMFLYGMTLLGSGLEKTSGGRLERTLEKLTDTVIKGVLLGALVTAAIPVSYTHLDVYKRQDRYGDDRGRRVYGDL